MTVVRGEYSSPEEMLEPYEGAWDLMVAFTAQMPPGVLWHCDACREHTPTTTLVVRPSHCGRPMELEAWASLQDFLTEA